jgi:hypothetical protein
MTADRRTIGISLLIVEAAVTVIVALGPRDGYASPDDAVRSACHPTTIVADVREGVVWWESTSQSNQRTTGPSMSTGVEWLASIKRANGGYRVDKCRFKDVPHG